MIWQTLARLVEIAVTLAVLRALWAARELASPLPAARPRATHVPGAQRGAGYPATSICWRR